MINTKVEKISEKVIFILFAEVFFYLGFVIYFSFIAVNTPPSPFLIDLLQFLPFFNFFLVAFMIVLYHRNTEIRKNVDEVIGIKVVSITSIVVVMVGYITYVYADSLLLGIKSVNPPVSQFVEGFIMMIVSIVLLAIVLSYEENNS